MKVVVKSYGKKSEYIPMKRDIVLVDLNPTCGHEQKGFRPAVIISNNPFNQFTKMAIVCPITSNTKDFPTHYRLQDTKKINGSVLCEHICSIDYEIRNLKYVEKMSERDFTNVVDLMNSCIED